MECFGRFDNVNALLAENGEGASKSVEGEIAMASCQICREHEDMRRMQANLVCEMCRQGEVAVPQASGFKHLSLLR